MIRKSTISVVLIAAIASPSVYAWGWKNAVEQTLVKNPNLQAQQQNASTFQLRYENARSLRLPRLTLQAGLQQYQNQTQEWQYRAFVGPRMQWLLYNGGKITSGIERADAASDGAQSALKVASVSTNFKLRQAFAQAVYAKKSIDLNHRIEQQRKNNVKLAEIRYQSGLEYKWAFLSSKVKWKKAELDVQRADMNKKTALADLENLLGILPIDSVTNIEDDDFYVTDAGYDLDQLLANADKNPTITLQQNKKAEAQANIDFMRADFYPEVGLQADFWAMSMRQNDLFPFWWTTLGISLPIFEAGRLKRNVTIAQQQYLQKSFDLEQAKLDVQTELKKNYQDYFISKQQVDINRLNVEANMDRAKVVSGQYRSGTASFLEWERSQDDWVNAELELLSSIRTYQINRARLEESIGMELGL